MQAVLPSSARYKQRESRQKQLHLLQYHSNGQKRATPYTSRSFSPQTSIQNVRRRPKECKQTKHTEECSGKSEIMNSIDNLSVESKRNQNRGDARLKYQEQIKRLYGKQNQSQVLIKTSRAGVKTSGQEGFRVNEQSFPTQKLQGELARRPAVKRSYPRVLTDSVESNCHSSCVQNQSKSKHRNFRENLNADLLPLQVLKTQQGRRISKDKNVKGLDNPKSAQAEVRHLQRQTNNLRLNVSTQNQTADQQKHRQQPKAFGQEPYASTITRIQNKFPSIDSKVNNIGIKSKVKNQQEVGQKEKKIDILKTYNAIGPLKCNRGTSNSPSPQRKAKEEEPTFEIKVTDKQFQHSLQQFFETKPQQIGLSQKQRTRGYQRLQQSNLRLDAQFRTQTQLPGNVFNHDNTAQQVYIGSSLASTDEEQRVPVNIKDIYMQSLFIDRQTIQPKNHRTFKKRRMLGVRLNHIGFETSQQQVNNSLCQGSITSERTKSSPGTKPRDTTKLKPAKRQPFQLDLFDHNLHKMYQTQESSLKTKSNKRVLKGLLAPRDNDSLVFYQ